jgi:hypothetical protein
MAPIDKVQFSPESGFNLEGAMELANLLSVAYNEYEVWDTNENLQDEKLLPKTITGSKAFIKLDTNNLEEYAEEKDNKINRDYQRLDKFWHQKEDKVVTYQRLHNFWFPEWWWGEVLKPRNIWELLKTDIRDIFEKLHDLLSDEPIFGFIAKSENKIYIVFRGTREAAEWFNNFRPVPKPFLPEEELGNLGEVRNGFNLIYTSKREGIDLDTILRQNIEPKHLTIEKTITQFVDTQLNEQSEIFVTGHSLGAGLATLAVLHIHKLAERKKVKPKSIQLYTFASPRVGDETFASYFDTDAIQSFRIINSEDLIQAVPLPTTEIVDEETFRGMSNTKKARFLAFKTFLNAVTSGQAEKHYQHIGIPVTFTKQTGKIAGNHNLTNTYREALRE